MHNPIGILPVICWRCDSDHVIQAPVSNLLAWQGGELIHTALPMLSANDRELLISNTCGDCWDDMFGESEDEFDEVFWVND